MDRHFMSDNVNAT